MPNDELMASLFRSSGSFIPARYVEDVPDALLLERFVDQWDQESSIRPANSEVLNIAAFQPASL